LRWLIFIPALSWNTLDTMQVVAQPISSTLINPYARPSFPVITAANGPGPSSVMPTPPLPPTRKRKRATQDYSISYSEVQEVDSDGRLREVIVIDDTPPPTMSPATTRTGAFSASYQPPSLYSAPIRTRARAAAEAQQAALSASTSSAITAPLPKKRKRELDEVRTLPTKRPVQSSQQSYAVGQTKSSWDSRSAAATDDVCPLFPRLSSLTHIPN
jgi:dual-specificity kinase